MASAALSVPAPAVRADLVRDRPAEARPGGRYPGWAAATAAPLALALPLAVLLPETVAAFAALPLLLSLAVLGLPHGAVDHHVPARLGARGGPRFVAAYAGLALLALAGWALAPTAAFAAFLVLAALHWGQGEVWFARRAAGRAPFTGRVSLGLFVGARGALPIALPLLAHPAAAQAIAAQATATLGNGTGLILDPGPAGRAAGLGMLAALVAAAAIASVRDHRADGGAPPWRDVAELALLVTVFAVVPPLFAVGLYFLAWHSPRHVLRLMDGDPRQRAELRAGRPVWALLAFHREALMCTVLSLGGLAALLALAGPASAVGAALALIAALTWPHAAVVAWMDARRVGARQLSGL